jgi:hypothetical protein
MFRRSTKSLWSFIVLLSVQLTPTASVAPAAPRFERPSQSFTRAPLDQTTVSAPQKKEATPLWPGSRFTDVDRARALSRGLRYIYRTALNPRNFAQHGSDYVWCFYTLSVAVQDEDLKLMAHRMGVERALHWRRVHRSLPRHADADMIRDYAFGSDAADRLGLPDEKMKEQIRRAAPRYGVHDYFFFDPLTESPPSDVPDECEYDGTLNPRGSKICHVCKRPLKMMSRYDVWCDALIIAYNGDHYGVKLGAHYADVLKWLPVMRPYRDSEHATAREFFDTVYAVTHIVYTLNNYSEYRLSPTLLPPEYQFLTSNLRSAIKEDDPDMLGEFMDTLRAFGLTSEDPEIRAGMEYYLSHQHRDGSWGKMDIHNRYHPTWNGISGLSEYAWRAGEGLSFPDLRPLIERWNREH